MSSRALSCLFALLLVVAAPGCGGNDGNPDPDGGPDTDQGGGDQGGDDQGGDDQGIEDMGSVDAGDESAPVPGATGALAASNATSSSIDLTWSAATDDTTAASALEYRVYFSLSDNLDTVADVLANGTAEGDWTADLTARTVPFLALNQPYYFNVLVRDEADNVAAYDGADESTLDGTWQEVELPEDDDERIDYPEFSLSPNGDVALSWHRNSAYESRVAFRPRNVDTFGADSPWSEVGEWNAVTRYGFDGSLVSTTVRGEASPVDLLFGTYTAGAGATFEELATGVATYYGEDFFPCVAQNGDVMVAWLEGATPEDQSLWARFRTGGTWGTPSLVNTSEGEELSDLRVVCSPDGDHMLLFADKSPSPSALKARVYDASAGDWEAGAFTLSTGPGPASEAKATRTSDGRVVVVWAEANEDSEDSTYVLRARTYSGGTWSAIALLDDSLSGLVEVAAAVDDVHVVWRDGAELVTSRLDAGSTAWTSAASVGPVDAIRQICLVGDSFGGVLLAWRETTTVFARQYRDGWGSATTLRSESTTGTGNGSLGCVLDHRKRASVAFTTRPDIGSSVFSVNIRTFR